MKTIRFTLLSLMLLLVPAMALAVPVTVNYTADNAVVYYGILDLPGPLQFDQQVLQNNANNWRIADGNTFDIAEGHLLVFAFVAENFANPSPTNPGGFLAEIQVGDSYSNTTSANWLTSVGDFRDVNNDWLATIEFATEYGSNDDPSTIWYRNNNNSAVAGISGDAQWIWTGNNFGSGTDQVVSFFTGIYANSAAAPVPEPATLLLLGAGLMGVAGISRKRKKA